MATEMTPSERAARVDECERLIRAQCSKCKRGKQVQRFSAFSTWYHGGQIRCVASAIHERLRELKGDTDGE